jgi:hypothetical protein
MHKAARLLVAVIALCALGSVCFAADTVDVAVSAQIQDILELSGGIKYFMDDNPVPQGDATSFDFGVLTHQFPDSTEAGVWYSRRWFTIYLGASTGGRQYQITQTCTGIVNGSDNINSSVVVTPNYSDQDELVPGVPQGPLPPGAVTGDAGLAVSNDHVIYTSGSAGLSRIIQAIYSIPNDSSVSGFAPISLDQHSGTYSGTVTFTVTVL